MTSTTITSGQFSLRALLLFVLACALLIEAWRAFGANVSVGAAFVVLSALPVAKLRGRLRRAYLLAWLAVYGPFLGMAIYALIYVDCDHCKAAAWSILPYMPGLVPLEIAHRLVDLPPLPETLGPVFGIFTSAAMITALAWLIRAAGRWWWQGLAVGTTLVLGTFSAIGILALIRA